MREMGSVATAPLKDNMGSSTIRTKQGGETIPFFLRAICN